MTDAISLPAATSIGEPESRLQQFMAAAEPAGEVGARRGWLRAQELDGRAARRVEQIEVGVDVGETQHRDPALARAEELAGAAQPQVLARDLEAVAVLEDDLQPRPRGVGERVLVEQYA